MFVIPQTCARSRRSRVRVAVTSCDGFTTNRRGSALVSCTEVVLATKTDSKLKKIVRNAARKNLQLVSAGNSSSTSSLAYLVIISGLLQFVAFRRKLACVGSLWSAGISIRIRNNVRCLCMVVVMETLTALRREQSAKDSAMNCCRAKKSVSQEIHLFQEWVISIFLYDESLSFSAICEQPSEVGPCEGLFKRWFFNKQTGYCEPFDYGGCQGNSNRFESELQCRTTCNATTHIGALKIISIKLIFSGNCSSSFREVV